tara:strand:- start:186 stop:677 length:492 start_codon:yes stop_codon:yes gene_type:complete
VDDRRLNLLPNLKFQRLITIGDCFFSIKFVCLRTESDKIVLFDGVCGLCNAWVNFLIRFDLGNRLLFSPLQGDFAKENFPQAAQSLDSIVFIDRKKVYYKSGAALRILASLGGIWTMAWVLLCIPFFLRDPVYLFLARFRYQLFGKRKSCRVPAVEERSRFID